MELTTNFNVRLSEVDRAGLKTIAKRMERTEGDAVRILIRERARGLGLMSGPDQAKKEKALA
jgi:hypothetical protein